MFIFQSMTTISITIAVTVYVFLWISLRRNPLIPFYAAGELIQDIFTSKKTFFHFIAMFAILVMNKLELNLEAHMVQKVDYTPLIYQWEGDFVRTFQAIFQNGVLTYILTFFYIVVFPTMLIASMLLYSGVKDQRSFYAMFYAVMINYVVAIPFYLFFPVNEVWAFDPKVSFLIPNVFPTFDIEYRPLSGLNNNFPSLHTSISMTLALIAARSKEVRFARVMAVSTGMIIFSIFYLGIHWLTDMVAGMMLALFASSVGIRISESMLGLREFEWNRNLARRDISK